MRELMFLMFSEVNRIFLLVKSSVASLINCVGMRERFFDLAEAGSGTYLLPREIVTDPLLVEELEKMIDCCQKLDAFYDRHFCPQAGVSIRAVVCKMPPVFALRHLGRDEEAIGAAMNAIHYIITRDLATLGTLTVVWTAFTALALFFVEVGLWPQVLTIAQVLVTVSSSVPLAAKCLRVVLRRLSAYTGHPVSTVMGMTRASLA